jgi:GNAT superfamily N-acetyltransferase
MHPGAPREGLVLELLLDGNADDTSGRGHHGVVHGAAPTTDRFGTPNGALLFDGTDDHVVVAPPPLGDSAMSVSVWGRVDTGALGGWTNCIVCQDNGDDADRSRRIFQLSLLNGRIVWHRMILVEDPVARGLVIPGTWFHAAAVVDRGVHRLYIDGTPQGSARDAQRVHPDEPLYIGRKGTNETSFFFRGAIDDLRIYNRALTAEEVRRLHDERGYRVASGPRHDPISGSWEAGGGGVRLELRLDERHGVSGAVTSGPGNVALVRTGTFDPATRRLTLGGEAPHPQSGAPTPFVIDGALDRRHGLTVQYQFVDQRGTVTFSRPARWRRLRRRLRRRIEQQWLQRMEPVLVPVVRRLRARARPSPETNARLLRERGEALESLVFRDATPADISALAVLHAVTWAATYPRVRHPPTAELRERQWREAFARADGRWFCIVIENARRDLVGFAKGVVREERVGDLNKIYLAAAYHRLGLGRRLVGHVARRFLAQGVKTMTLSADAGNPSCLFYLALGAENPRDANGRAHLGAFVWRDVEKLAARCPL